MGEEKLSVIEDEKQNSLNFDGIVNDFIRTKDIKTAIFTPLSRAWSI